jgi:hypothetical protein
VVLVMVPRAAAAAGAAAAASSLVPLPAVIVDAPSSAPLPAAQTTAARYAVGVTTSPCSFAPPQTALKTSAVSKFGGSIFFSVTLKNDLKNDI